MALTSGSRLGPYEIAGPLGAGGMGEVYRARDTRLDRTVAIKVLPAHLSSDPETRQRFQREARAISALQHPHICTLHDVGSQDEIDYLVMEHLDGQTLAERLGKGPLPLAQALEIAIEIAAALQAAHQRGIIHRDLKPANIMLTKSGAKLMDFGLAKPEYLVPGGASRPLTPSSPTINVGALTSAPAQLTQKGFFVGTCQYMAPEVLQGSEADARSDIFSFGCVLYEMLTGHRAFEAKSQLGVLSAILEKEPEPIRNSQPLTAPMLERVVQGCLAKDPAERFQSIHDVMLDLQWMADSPAVGGSAGDGARKFSLAWLTVAAAIAIVLLAGVGIGSYWWSNHTAHQVSFHADIASPDGYLMATTGDAGGMPVLSPQGDMIAFVAHSPTTKTLWVRSLNSDTPQQLQGTEGAMHPFWSPDGKFVAFFANGKLRKVATSGGPITPLADVSNPRGGAWGKNDVIIYSPNILDGLWQVSANGGASTPATQLAKTSSDTHRWPWILPDGNHFIFLATNHRPTDAKQGIYWGTLGSDVLKFVIATDSAAEFASGYLLYHANGDLVAQPFNPASGTLSGVAQPLVNNVRNDSGVWRAVFSASDNGTLIYQSGVAAAAGSRLTWFDLQGKQLEQMTAGQNQAIDVRVAPDGKQIAVAETSGLWVLDTMRKTHNRVTFGQTLAEEPSWSPDGKTIVFATGLRLLGVASGTDTEIRSVPSDGSGQETVLGKAHSGAPVPSWTGDGKYLAYLSNDGAYGSVLWAKPLEGTDPARVILRPPTNTALVWTYRVSNDAHWVAYVSDETGQQEIYMSRFPEGIGKWRVSSNGGAYPAWSADGKEVFYKDMNDDFWMCPIQVNGAGIEVGTPQHLFHASQPGLGIPFDVSPDGKRLLVNLAEEQAVTPLKLMTNWPAMLGK